MPIPPSAPVALLVDGDNVPPTLLEPLLERLGGPAAVPERKVFRNWRSTKDSQSWDAATKRLAFERVDRYKTTEGKNGSDIAAAVAAMDLWHAGLRSFCLVTGDTDFGPLVERLRRGGAYVLWVGHKADGGLLAELADDYLDWKQLVGGKAARGPQAARAPRAPRPPAAPRPPPPAPAARPARRAPHAGRATPPRLAPPAARDLATLLLDAYEVARTDGEVDADGWVPVDRLGQIARSVDPGYAPARYGLGRRAGFTAAFEKHPGLFETRSRGRRGKAVQYEVRRR